MGSDWALLLRVSIANDDKLAGLFCVVMSCRVECSEQSFGNGLPNMRATRNYNAEP
ncbi:hypothetical protein Mal52_21850 [Symmachiella dynata]|uniref:Uncharacterized protein n=1 Tax=Symmachiella dynata TaxID=2527995 RepID=A0A517ZMJ7_9PLAN|nr:hypothetical protein Mal52_21850 [Symmachiella dynata]